MNGVYLTNMYDEDYIKKAVESTNEFDQNSKKKNFNLDNYR